MFVNTVTDIMSSWCSNNALFFSIPGLLGNYWLQKYTPVPDVKMDVVSEPFVLAKSGT